MKDLFPYRPDLVKLGTALRRFSMSFGVSGILIEHISTNPLIFWISFILLGIGGIGEMLTYLYSK